MRSVSGKEEREKAISGLDSWIAVYGENALFSPEKSIINLVMRLAICIYRGYIQQYPVKLDEIDDGCSPIHQDRLTSFLVEFLNKKNILQAFVVNQSVAVSSSFTDAGMILLSDDDVVPEHCIVKSKIN